MKIDTDESSYFKFWYFLRTKVWKQETSEYDYPKSRCSFFWAPWLLLFSFLLMLIVAGSVTYSVLIDVPMWAYHCIRYGWVEPGVFALMGLIVLVLIAIVTGVGSFFFVKDVLEDQSCRNTGVFKEGGFIKIATNQAKSFKSKICPIIDYTNSKKTV